MYAGIIYDVVYVRKVNPMATFISGFVKTSGKKNNQRNWIKFYKQYCDTNWTYLKRKLIKIFKTIKTNQNLSCYRIHEVYFSYNQRP